MSLKGRVSVVTAAGSGIGRAAAEAMAREGAFVVATDLIAERAEETAARIVSAGGRADARGVDVGAAVDDKPVFERLGIEHKGHNQHSVRISGARNGLSGQKRGRFLSQGLEFVKAGQERGRKNIN